MTGPFDPHRLDDPRPPVPDRTVLAAVAARGHRLRARRRAGVAGGWAVLAVALVVLAAATTRPADDDTAELATEAGTVPSGAEGPTAAAGVDGADLGLSDGGSGPDGPGGEEPPDAGPVATDPIPPHGGVVPPGSDGEPGPGGTPGSSVPVGQDPPPAGDPSDWSRVVVSLGPTTLTMRAGQTAPVEAVITNTGTWAVRYTTGLLCAADVRTLDGALVVGPLPCAAMAQVFDLAPGESATQHGELRTVYDRHEGAPSDDWTLPPGTYLVDFGIGRLRLTVV